ncbi:MAG: RHS repeat-associated core domain-containing protein [Ktedonobacteraceae bacterium]
MRRWGATRQHVPSTGTGTVSGDTNVYATTTSIDPNNHVAVSFSDGLGRTRYAQNDSGVNGGTLTPNEQTAIQYNVLDEPTSVTETDLAPQSGQTITSVTASATYDDIGRLTGVNDPDRGNDTYTLDPNGNVLSDVSGTRTIGYNYDLLGRLGCIQDAAPTINATGTCTTGTHPYVQNIYDISAPHAQWSGTDSPVGRLTQSIATTYNPDGGAITATQNIQHDQRGQAITEQLKLGLPGGWNVTNALPTYQMALSYNDANQPATMATSTVNAQGSSTPGYTATDVYDSTAGTLVGLSNNGNPTANVATLLYNEYALVDTVNFQTNTGSALANEQFGYDGDLRATSAAANWQSGSGTSGQLFSQSIFYDPASNVTSNSSGFAGAGNSETANFCYDEQNRLVWSGNTSAPPSPGNGTCGNQTPSSGLSGSGYTNSFVYTHLGQLWQGPLNGGSTQYQYLYCNSSHQHQLTGMYPMGTTCPNLSGAVYTSSYDAWGNVTGRSYAGASSTQTFDMLNRLTKWFVGSTSKEYYGYDATGDRVLRRSVSGGATAITVYAFGSEEYTYDGTGNLQSSTHYYSLGGQLVGALTGTSTNLFLTDALGSVLESLSNIAGSAAIEGNQTFSPYGTPLHSQGTMGTNLAFTGQYHDALTGFDYYGARYYDPVAGVFLSADIVQGNLVGADPYTYVGGNPETFTDPTGDMYVPHGGGGGGGGGSSPPPSHPNSNTNSGGGGILGDIGSIFSGGVQIVEHATGEIAKIVADPETDPALPIFEKVAATAVAAEPEVEVATVGGLDFTEFAVCPLCAGAVMIISFLANPTPLASGTLSTPISTAGNGTLGGLIPGTGGQSINIVSQDNSGSGPQPQAGGGGQGNKPPGGGVPPVAGDPCSFTPDTRVTTNHGEQPIGKLQTGEKVLSYNPKTHKMELEPILHVWKHTDNDLIDLTITTTAEAYHGKYVVRTNETVHTTSEHPFLTAERGFLPAGKIKAGMHILRADGSTGVITGWKIVHATKVMYNLEVANDHTFVVGNGEWIVHNKCAPGDRGQLRRSLRNDGKIPDNAPTQAHHLIPCEFKQNSFVQQAISGGFGFNSPGNGIALPTNAAGSAILKLPFQMGPHEAYNLGVRQRLGDLNADSAEEAAKALQGLANDLRDAIVGAGGGGCINDLFA